MRAGIAEQGTLELTAQRGTRPSILADEQGTEVVAHGGQQAAERISALSMRTKMLSACLTVAPAIATGLLRGSPSGMASTRRMISGSRSPMAPWTSLRASMACLT